MVLRFIGFWTSWLILFYSDSASILGTGGFLFCFCFKFYFLNISLSLLPSLSIQLILVVISLGFKNLFLFCFLKIASCSYFIEIISLKISIIVVF